MPDIAPVTTKDGYQEYGVKKMINDMVVYEPENRLPLSDAEHGITCKWTFYLEEITPLVSLINTSNHWC